MVRYLFYTIGDLTYQSPLVLFYVQPFSIQNFHVITLKSAHHIPYSSFISLLVYDLFAHHILFFSFNTCIILEACGSVG